MILLRSLLFALIFYPGTFLWVMAALIVTPFGPRPLRAVVGSWGWFHRIAARIVLAQKVKIDGVIPDTPMLFIFKHESMFETIDLLCLFHNPMIAAKRELIDIPLWGRVARTYGMIIVEREAGASAMRSMRRTAAKAMAEGRPVCLFPEGTRVPHGEAPEIRAGFAGLYTLLRVPVLPIAVNSGRVAPRNSFLKRPGTVTYKVGEIIPPGLPREEAEALAHAAINALNE
ncbi:lysophospholipid acyltransferase family protein [Sphingobium phenoxybenzoativorans]|uniref:lysophospholipid acyltransferase family protein n=1 Tax=Sphingobium phenoxybenzoativorans TaxID=1592790 RepID=UPI0008733CB2|nr:lysophospholipid acyltransferase family protein [Sphingobium phenoxybenzoativorans]